MVLDVLGAVDTSVLGRLFRSVLNADVLSCIGILERRLSYRGANWRSLSAILHGTCEI